MSEPDEGKVVYAVVINDEEQYSIWPDHSEPPAGWSRTGFAGPEPDCLSHIDEVWTDMRPKSLRERMRAAEEADTGPSR
jgi:MbtH protein